MYRRHDRDNYGWYVKSNSLTLLVYCSAMLFGGSWGLIGLKNTATTYLVLWCIEKYFELAKKFLDAVVVFAFVFFIFVYYMAMWLHSNPEFVISLFQVE